MAIAVRRTRARRERRASRSSEGPPSTRRQISAGTASAPASPASWPWKMETLLNVTAARIASASRLIRVWEKTVPAMTASRWRVRPSSRRASTSTRVGSPTRPGNTAEPITPIIVARTTEGQAICVSGRAARSVCCQEIERHSRDRAISSSDSATHPGLAVSRSWPIACRSRRESANTTRPATASATAGTRMCLSPSRRGRGGGAGFFGRPGALLMRRGVSESGKRSGSPGCGQRMLARRLEYRRSR